MYTQGRVGRHGCRGSKQKKEVSLISTDQVKMDISDSSVPIISPHSIYMTKSLRRSQKFYKIHLLVLPVDFECARTVGECSLSRAVAKTTLLEFAVTYY